MRQIDHMPTLKPLSILGSGSFGSVLEVLESRTNTRLALKLSYKFGDAFSREIEMLDKVKDCKYTVNYLDSFYSFHKKTRYSSHHLVQKILFELLPQSLEDYLNSMKENNSFIPIEDIRKIAKQLLLGINYIHKKNIVHRDLRPANILLSETGDVKICDFGAAKEIDNSNDKVKKAGGKRIESNPNILVLNYRPPEIIFGKTDYDMKVDIFSAGLTIGELFTLEPLFQGKDIGLQMCHYINVLGIPDNDYFKEFDNEDNKEFIEILKDYTVERPSTLQEILGSRKEYDQHDIDDASDLIQNMIKWDYNTRFSAEECLRHKFFTRK